MELPLIALILNMRLQHFIDAARGTLVRLIVVRHGDGNVLDNDADERFLGDFSADVLVAAWERDEAHYHVEGGESDFCGVEFGYVGCEGFFGGGGGEGCGWVVDDPERHFGGLASVRLVGSGSGLLVLRD